VITPSSEFQLYTLGQMLNASSRLVKLELPIVRGLTLRGFLAVAVYILLGSVFALAQQESPLDAKINRQRGLEMLADIQRTLTEQYYDPSFHGIDLNGRFRIAKERIKDLQTNAQIFRVIAQVVLDLNDSHTIFIPPSHYNRMEYGFSLQMVGDVCHIVNVKHGSDAEAQGLKDGDVVISVANVPPLAIRYGRYSTFCTAWNQNPS
jgi:C-terminal processing protease CtpA/Prc